MRTSSAASTKRTVVKTSIGAGYLRNGWGKEALLREVLSNAKDAAEMHGDELVVEHKGSTLIVTNKGTTLSRRNMLLGGGDKFGRSDTIGQFEEGLKLALLVAARENIKVKIRTGYEAWKPAIKASAAFGGEEVLAITVVEGDEYFDGTSVEISGVTAAEWAVERQKYLFLLDDASIGRVQPTSYASTDVLTAAGQKGRVYVRGVFVQVMDDIAYGYDLRSAKVDRDRKMVDAWDAKYQMTEALTALSAKNAQVAKTLYEQAKLNKGDGAGYTLGYAQGAALDALVEAFDADFGADAVPCSDAEQVKQLRYLGKNAAVVPEKLREALEKRRGKAATALEHALNQPAKVIPGSELTATERDNLDMALSLLSDVGLTTAVDVVEFHDAKLDGRIHVKSEMINVARRTLTSVKRVMEVLVHELAHRESGAGDGTTAHTQAVETIWSKLWAKAIGV